MIATQEDNGQAEGTAEERPLGNFANGATIQCVTVDGAAALGVRKVTVSHACHRVLSDDDGDIILFVQRLPKGLKRKGAPVHQLRPRMQVLEPDAAGPVAIDHHDFLSPCGHQPVDSSVHLCGQESLGCLVVLAVGVTVLLERHDPCHTFQIGHHQDLHPQASCRLPELTLHEQGRHCFSIHTTWGSHRPGRKLSWFLVTDSSVLRPPAGASE